MRKSLPLAMMMLAALGFVAVVAAQESGSVPAATTAPAKPAVDHVKGLIDSYDQGQERLRFFAAAGVDSELSKEEFAAVAGKPDSFVRSYDKWEAAVAYDKDANGTLNWVEAEQYRLAMRQKLLGTYDRNKDGKLTERERDAANGFLAGGGRGSRGSRDRGGQSTGRRGRRGQNSAAPPAADGGAGESSADNVRRRIGQLTAEADKDGDGQVSAEEGRAAMQAMRDRARQRQLDQYDKNGDGEIDETERQAMQDEWRRRGEEMRAQYELRRYDADKDGVLDEQEMAARDAESERRRQQMEEAQQRAEEARKAFMDKWDADKDGTLSDEERQAVRDEIQAQMEQRRKAMDTDQDGEVSREEIQKYMEGLRSKYDEDGDGQLSPEERRKMFQGEAGGFFGGGMMGASSVVGGRGGRGGATGARGRRGGRGRGTVSVTVEGGGNTSPAVIVVEPTPPPPPPEKDE